MNNAPGKSPDARVVDSLAVAIENAVERAVFELARDNFGWASYAARQAHRLTETYTLARAVEPEASTADKEAPVSPPAGSSPERPK